MIFVGDVAIAHGDEFSFDGFDDKSIGKPWCINLEGAITGSNDVPAWGVYNTSTWAESFAGFNLGPTFIGNNHIHDVPDGIRSTLAELEQQGIAAFGAGKNPSDATRCVASKHGDQEYVLLGFGWPVIGCQPVSSRRPGVNRLEGKSAIRQAKEAVRDAGRARVVVVFHGNYEFERYPQPAHRRLFMALIDHGVYAVIGHHPHIVGPIERYKGHTIAYSLGNWAFSYGRFFGGKLRFPESSFHQIAIELSDGGDVIHHARFSPPATVTYGTTERVDSKDLSLKPEFEGFSHSDYVHWFKQNRIKRKGLPVYLDANDTIANWFRDRWVSIRQVLVDSAAKSGLKAMRRKA